MGFSIDLLLLFAIVFSTMARPDTNSPNTVVGYEASHSTPRRNEQLQQR